MKTAAYYKGISGYTYLRLTASRAELLRIPRPGMPKAMVSRFEDEEDIDVFGKGFLKLIPVANLKETNRIFNCIQENTN